MLIPKPLFCFLLFVLCICLYVPAKGGVSLAPEPAMDAYHLFWAAPASNFRGAIPLGNGDIGVSAWVDKDGELLFYIGKTDAYDGNSRLLKLGLVHVKITPNPFAQDTPFQQELDMKKGMMMIHAGKGNSAVTCRLWVDANHPVIHVDVHATKPVTTSVQFQTWRKQPRDITDELAFSDVYVGLPKRTIQSPNTILRPSKSDAPAVMWYHRNEKSCWPITMKLQGLERLTSEETDPLFHRTFGGMIVGDHMKQVSATELQSVSPMTEQHVDISALTATTPTANAWIGKMKSQMAEVRKVDIKHGWSAHEQWWHEFWNRSWIDLTGTASDSTTERQKLIDISRGYACQRYLMACGGRGADWVKYNGSIFTLPWRKGSRGFMGPFRDAANKPENTWSTELLPAKDAAGDPDFRQWGPAQWFQNARLTYWPMIAAGDDDVLHSFFQQFVKNLPFAKARAKIYYNDPGAFFNETSYIWGSYANSDYGWWHLPDPAKRRGYVANRYMRWYWSGSLELTAMMLTRYQYTQDENFLKSTLMPVASAVLEFYGHHWQVAKDGKFRFNPAHALETYQGSHVVNPMPIVAGLRYVIPQMLALPHDVTTAAQRAYWKKLLSEVPALPVKVKDGKKRLIPADKYGNSSNREDPELYALFPYRLFGVGLPDLALGKYTYKTREYHGNICWWQDDIWAALLGLTDDAQKNVTWRMLDYNKKFAFPGNWGPNNDDLPDLDHGGVGMMALQYMLVQCLGKKIYLLPAWPGEWNARFKLRAAYQTTVQGMVKNGKLVKLSVTPESRRSDIVLYVPASAAVTPSSH